MKLTRNESISGGLLGDHEYPEPYIEVDGLYAGVRLRKITALSDKQQDELLMKADEIYCDVMGVKK